MPFPEIETLIQAGTLVLLAGLMGYVAWLRHSLRQQQRAAESRLAALEQELTGLSSGTLGVGRKLLTVEQRLQDTERRTQELSLSDPVKVSYSEAARLLGLGADVDDLVAGCGLSRPEAELVAALHRQRSVV